MLVNFNFNFGFHDCQFRKFLSHSLDDFSANLDPNLMIFDSVNFSLSLLPKIISFPNFSPHFIIRFDLISKDILKFRLFSVDSTLIHHYAPNL